MRGGYCSRRLCWFRDNIGGRRKTWPPLDRAGLRKTGNLHDSETDAEPSEGDREQRVEVAGQALHPKRGNTVYVVEVKEDAEISDPSAENQKKFEYARDHFDRLNKWLKGEAIAAEYQLNFLTPKDFNKFFIKLRKGEAKGFRSELDIVLANQGTSNGRK